MGWTVFSILTPTVLALGAQTLNGCIVLFSPALLFVVVARQTTVYIVGCSGHIACLVRRQPGRERGYILRRAQTIERNLFKQCVDLWFVVEQGLVHRRGDGAGSYVVDGDSQMAQFNREIAHQHAQASLAGTVGRKAGKGYVFGDGTDIDDTAGPL